MDDPWFDIFWNAEMPATGHIGDLNSHRPPKGYKANPIGFVHFNKEVVVRRRRVTKKKPKPKRKR